MSFNLTTDATGDKSLAGIGDGESTTALNFTEAKNNMESDSWSGDSYALIHAGMYVYAAWHGIGHLMKSATTGHLCYKAATGHLLIDEGEIAGSCWCIAILDRCQVPLEYQGTSVSSIGITFGALVQNVNSVPGYTAEFYFKTTDSDIPDDDWGWFTGSYKSVNFSETTATTNLTFSSISGLTLASRFYCIYRLSSYSIPSYDSSGATPVGAYYTKDIKVTFGVSNTYVIN